ncbi:MAG: CsbD family protein [Acidimicrobiales bacterium]
MADAKGKAKEALGWLTADRELEAEGQAEQEADDEPTEDDVREETAEVRKEYGETPDGSDEPDALH